MSSNEHPELKGGHPPAGTEDSDEVFIDDMDSDEDDVDSEPDDVDDGIVLPTSEEAAIAFFQEKGLLPTRRICTRGHEMKLTSGVKISWRCHKKGCRLNSGVRAGTWFETSRLPFLTALKFILAWSRQTTSVKWCKEELGLNKNTVVDWNNDLREVIVDSLRKRGRRKIGGPGLVVELDECTFTTRKTKAGLLPQHWILGGLCRETKESFVIPLPKHNSHELTEAIIENVRSGSVIHSDSWNSYCAETLGKAGLSRLDPSADAGHAIKGMWGSVKWRNKVHHGTAHQHLEAYLAEFMWRRTVADPFPAILEAIKDFKPPKITVDEKELKSAGGCASRSTRPSATRRSSSTTRS